MNLLFMIAVLPGAALLYYIYRLDPVEKEPPKLLLALGLFGVLSTVPAVILEVAADSVFSLLPQNSLVYFAVKFFIGVALVEELCKFVFLYLRSWRAPAFDYLFDGIVYAVFVSLGFAIAENITYVFEFGIVTGVVRAVTAIPGHTIFAVFMGYFFANAKIAEVEGNGAKKAKNLILAIVVPMLLHGAYDFLATLDSLVSFLVFLVLLIAMAIAAFRLVKREAAAARRISVIQAAQNANTPYYKIY